MTFLLFAYFLFGALAQSVFALSPGINASPPPPARFRDRPDHVPLALDQAFYSLAPSKPTNVEVLPLVSQGIAALNWKDGTNFTASSFDESYIVVCSYDGKCSNKTSLGWSSGPVGRNATQNYATGLPVNGTNYYCLVAVTNTINQTTCSDPVLLTKPAKATGLSSGVVGANGDTWVTTWIDGWPTATPTETYRGKCVKQGTGCNGELLGYSYWYIPPGVRNTAVGGLPIGFALDCYVIASNVVGETCSDPVSVVTINPYCAINPVPQPANTAFFVNRGTGAFAVIGKVTQCSVVGNTLVGSSCSVPPAATGFNNPRSIVRYGASTLFVSNSGANNLNQCTISGSPPTITNCVIGVGGYTFTPNGPSDMVIKDSFMYLTLGTGGTLAVCALGGGTILSCTTPPTPLGWDVGNSYSIANLGNVLYIGDKVNNRISTCIISSPGTIGYCTVPSTPLGGWNLNSPSFMTFDGCTLYITNTATPDDAGYITQCTINPFTLGITRCYVPLPAPASVVSPRGIEILGNVGYITNQIGANPITRCVLSNGAIQSCAFDTSVNAGAFDQPVNYIFTYL